MRAGELDNRIQLFKKKPVRSTRGEPSEELVKVGEPVWASVSGVGRERPENYQEDQYIAIQRREFRIWWRGDIDATYVILHLDEDKYYDVEATQPLGRREGLIILAVARGDQK